MLEPASTARLPGSKIRLRFTKTGDLRFLSHHDLMRLMERLLRRAGMPLRFTAGFHPKPKIVFANALSLGIVGRQEVVEIEFEGALEPAAVLSALTTLAPDGLTFLTATALGLQQNAQPLAALYYLPLSPDSFPDLAERIAALLRRETVVIERIRHIPKRSMHEEPPGEERLDALTRAAPRVTKTEHKTIDLRPLLRRVYRDAQGLWMDLGITNQGAARPEEVLRYLELEHLLQEGEAVLERVALTLADEACPAMAGRAPESGPEGTGTCVAARSAEPQSAPLITAPAYAGPT
jgi:radical SAM-linked protein